MVLWGVGAFSSDIKAAFTSGVSTPEAPILTLSAAPSAAEFEINSPSSTDADAFGLSAIGAAQLSPARERWVPSRYRPGTCLTEWTGEIPDTAAMGRVEA